MQYWRSATPFQREDFPIHAARLGWAAPAVFNTGSLVETQRRLEGLRRGSVLNIFQPRLFGGYRESVIRMPRIALSLTSIASPDGYELGFRPLNEYCLNIPLNGQGSLQNGSQMIELKSDQGAFVSPGCMVRKYWQGPSEVLTLHIPMAAMHEDQHLDAPVNLPPLAVINLSDTPEFVGLIRMVCAHSCSPDSVLLRAPVAEHLERTILAMLLRLLPHHKDEVKQKPSSPALPYYVRRAERYMLANLRQALTLNELASAAGVSVRTLQYGFKHHHGVTPMFYAKRLRLNYARAIILSEAEKPLYEIALDIGYQNASHFASDYREAFGELPSQTLMRAKRLCD